MTCGHCEEKVVAAINALGLDVHDLSADHAKGVVTMCMDSNYDTIEAKVKEAIEASGFHYEGCGHGHEHGHGGHDHGH